jgi:hypothetical protein
MPIIEEERPLISFLKRFPFTAPFFLLYQGIAAIARRRKQKKQRATPDTKRQGDSSP